jgi:hypothetical protein
MVISLWYYIAWYGSYPELVFTYILCLPYAQDYLVVYIILATYCLLLIHRGSYDPRCCVLVFKCKINVCTHLGGAHIYIRTLLLCFSMYTSYAIPCVVIKHQK